MAQDIELDQAEAVIDALGGIQIGGVYWWHSDDSSLVPGDVYSGWVIVKERITATQYTAAIANERITATFIVFADELSGRRTRTS